MLDDVDHATSNPGHHSGPSRHAGPSTDVKPKMPLQSNAFYTTKDVMSAYEHHQAELAQLARSKSSPSKSALQPLDANKLSKTPSGDMNRDIKPLANSRNPWEGFGKGKAPVRSIFDQPTLDVDTEDDDDVIELQDDKIPLGMKKNKSTPRIYTIDDDDEDEDEVELNIKPRILSSQPSSSWRASQQRIKAEREQRGHRGSSQSLHSSVSATRSPIPSPAVKSESTSRPRDITGTADEIRRASKGSARVVEEGDSRAIREGIDSSPVGVQESQDWVGSSCQSHTLKLTPAAQPRTITIARSSLPAGVRLSNLSPCLVYNRLGSLRQIN
jgi:hypothetical protein